MVELLVEGEGVVLRVGGMGWDWVCVWYELDRVRVWNCVSIGGGVCLVTCALAEGVCVWEQGWWCGALGTGDGGVVQQLWQRPLQGGGWSYLWKVRVRDMQTNEYV